MVGELRKEIRTAVLKTEGENGIGDALEVGEAGEEEGKMERADERKRKIRKTNKGKNGTGK